MAARAWRGCRFIKSITKTKVAKHGWSEAFKPHKKQTHSGHCRRCRRRRWREPPPNCPRTYFSPWSNAGHNQSNLSEDLGLVKKSVLWALKLLNDGPNKSRVDKCSSLLRLFWFEELDVQDRIGTMDELVVYSHMPKNKEAVKTISQERTARSS
jgi:hypothetical protein